MTADETSAWVVAEGNVYKLNKPTFEVVGGIYVANATLVTETVGATPATYDMVMCVKIGASQDYVLVPQPGINPDILSAYPGEEIEAAINAWKPKTEDQLKEIAKQKEADYNKANSDKDKKELAMNKAKEQLDADSLALAAAQDLRDYLYEYRYNYRGTNEMLEKVYLNAKTEVVGDRAFANCIRAEFPKHTFAPVAEYIGKEAFLNTLLDVADFSKSTSEDLDIKEDAFTGTPLTQLKLEGTTSENINPGLVKAIAQSLKKVAGPLEIAFCDAKRSITNYNNTLTTVTLPTGEYFDEISDYAFQKCWALTSINFPTSVTAIGARAFQYTNIPEFDLTALEGLATVGEAAFSRNPSLDSVKFAKEALLTELKGNTFTGSCALKTVKFNDAMKVLGEGLFATNVLEDLNLANTHVETLEDLFYAGTGFDGEGNLVRPAGMPDGAWTTYQEHHSTVPNTTLKTVELPTTGTLTHIKKFALQSLKSLQEIVVPSSVTTMGWSVFMNDVALKSAKFEDTPMTGLHSHTFAQCLSLEEVIFTSVNGVVPSFFGANPLTPYVFGYEPINYNWNADPANSGYGFGDNLFFASNTAKTPENTPMPVVTVSMDDFMKLQGTKEYLQHYSTLKAALTTIELGGPIKYNGVDYYWKTFKSPYGTWIKAGKGVDVFTAYEDGDDVILYPAKIRGGYYKIAAYDPNGNYRISNDITAAAGTDLHLGNDDASVCIIRSTSQTITATADYKNSPLLIRNGDLKVQSTLDLENQLMAVQGDIWGNSATNFYVFGKKIDGTLTFKHITSDTYVIETGDICLMTTTDKGLESRNIVVVEPDEATAVQGVKEYLEGVKSGAIYNLQGVRVSTTQKGKMYIQGGKKFIQK